MKYPDGQIARLGDRVRLWDAAEGTVVCMASHTSLAVVARVATVFGVALTFQVRADADKVAFPDNYATGVMYLSLDKPESKQVHQIFAMPEAFAAARKVQPINE